MADFVIEAKALNVDLEIEKGATFDPVIRYKKSDGSPVDITSWTAKMEIRELDEPNAVLDTLIQGDGIILGDALGTITFNITKARNIAYDWVTAQTDLFLNDGAKDYKIMYGNVLVVARVTQ